MTISRSWTLAATAALLATAGCTSGPQIARQPPSAVPLDGAVGGYLLGDIAGGRQTRTMRVVGAGIGGVAGADIGAYMDRQERDLRTRTAGSDIRVTRAGDDLILTIPSGITFAYKSDAVAPSFQPTLEQVAGVLHAYERCYVDVYGHTDSVGSDSYNLGLSERRAKSVADDLAAHGVDAARVGTRGFGKTQPIASNETPEGQAANRRVEIKIVPIHANELR